MSWDEKLRAALCDVVEACNGLLDGYSERRWEWLDEAMSSVRREQSSISEDVVNAGRHGMMNEHAARLQILYSKSESPIEALMASALHGAMRDFPALMGAGYRVQQQAKFADYRLDFLVWRSDENGRLERPALAVECDGKDFHTASMTQVNRDKARDRFLQRYGVMVFRYPGADIWADADGCAREALKALDAAAAVGPRAIDLGLVLNRVATGVEA